MFALKRRAFLVLLPGEADQSLERKLHNKSTPELDVARRASCYTLRPLYEIGRFSGTNGMLNASYFTFENKKLPSQTM